MSTTTLRLPDELKSELGRLAEAEGTTSHALMIEMLAEGARARRARAEFHAEAERRWKRMQRTGEYLTHDDLRNYAQALARGDKPEPPTPRVMEPAELARLRSRARRAEPR